MGREAVWFMKRFGLFFLFSLSIVLTIGFFVWWQRGTVSDFASDVERTVLAPAPQSFEEVVKNTKIAESAEDLENKIQEISPTTPTNTPTLPPTFNLAVPFTSQAPFANWDLVHEDTCEEAALYMVHEFYSGTPAGKIDPATAEAELMKIVEFEKVLFGFFESTTAAQIAVLAEQMYGYEKVEVIENPSVEDLKTYVASGYPVIIPTAGRMLGNPNFTGEGPLYHALVLKGFTETTFVTNDPGTRLGADYQYSFDIVMEAMHDWNGGDVERGAKVAVVVYPI
jgi:hypothetical protein